MVKKGKNAPEIKQEYRSSIDFENYEETWITIPPDGGWGWVVVFASFIINFFIDGLTYCFGLFLEDISRDLKVHPTSVAWATSLMTGFYYFAGPLACGLTNRFGFRFVSILGTLITAGSFFGASYLTSLIPFLVLIGFVAGVGLNMVYTPCLLIVGFYFERWRALTTAISVTGTSVGIMVFPILVNNLLKKYSWRTKFKIFSGIFVGLITFMLTFRPIKPTRVIQERKTPDIGIQQSDSDEAQGWGVLRMINRMRNYPGGNVDNTSAYYEIFPDDNDDATSYVPAAFATTSMRQSFLSYGGLSVVTGMGQQEKPPETCCQKYCCCCCFEQVHEMNRPMYRDDIFFGGSVYRLSQYNQAPAPVTTGPHKRKPLVSYHISVSRVISETELVQSQKVCVCCHQAILRVLLSMLDYRLFKSPSFVLLVASGFFTSLALYTPYTFMIERCKEIGLERQKGSFLMTIAGFSSTIGRILCGILSCLPRVDALIVSYVTLFVAAAATIVSCFLNDWITQVVFVALYGLNTASFNVLRTVVLADMLGLENLTNAFGINIMFYGIASFIGIPIAGTFQRFFGKYAYAILFAGSSLMVSAILLVPIRHVKKKEDNKKKRKTVSFK